jgi:cobalamin biosynthesis Mg chelatase CobN
MSDDNGSRDTEQIRAEIDHTREELAETVEALTAKTDVKGRATQKAHEVQDSAKVRAQALQETAKVRAHEAQETAKVRAQAAKATVTEQAKVIGAQAKVKSEQARVKGAQAKVVATEKAHTAQETVQQQRQDKPWLLPAIGGVVGLLSTVFVWLRRRRNR